MNITTTQTTAAATNMIIKNAVLFVKISQELASVPANFPPIDVIKNQPPIMRAVKRGGEIFEINDNPIGLKNNSPMVKTA